MYLRLLTIPVLTLCFLALPADAHAAESSAENAKASENASGLPIPRFVSLRFEEVNVRTGPGTRYPIRWVYKRKGMPVEIVEEFGDWRKLRDIEGDEGWSHKNQLSGARSVIIREDTTLKRYASEEAPAMLKARKGVTARLLECDPNWCEVQIQSYKAWISKKGVWGIYPQETLK